MRRTRRRLSRPPPLPWPPSSLSPAPPTSRPPGRSGGRNRRRQTGPRRISPPGRGRCPTAGRRSARRRQRRGQGRIAYELLLTCSSSSFSHIKLTKHQNKEKMLDLCPNYKAFPEFLSPLHVLQREYLRRPLPRHHHLPPALRRIHRPASGGVPRLRQRGSRFDPDPTVKVEQVGGARGLGVGHQHVGGVQGNLFKKVFFGGKLVQKSLSLTSTWQWCSIGTGRTGPSSKSPSVKISVESSTPSSLLPPVMSQEEPIWDEAAASLTEEVWDPAILPFR